MSMTIFYGDARDDPLASSADKQNNALSHFNFFLKTYCVQIGINIVEAVVIPYHGIPLQSSNKAIFEFWDKMIGAFFSYMGTSAMCFLNPKGRRLAYQSATQYCSSIKVFFVNKFRNEPSIPVFQPEQWKKLRDNLRGKYREGSRASGKRMTEGKISSTREDREAMATGCIWLGDAKSAEFWHLLNTSYHCSGRGSEVSLITPEGTTVAEVNEDVYQYSVLQTDVQRQKDGPFQSLSIYPHRDGVLEDFYFSLIYLIVMVGCGNEYVFPSFSEAALKTKSNKSDSKVSSLWTDLFDKLRNTFETLSDRINEKLSSHCNKKGSNQVMADSPLVSGLAQIFRTGWELRGCDTLFEYICGSSVMSQQAGKAVSKWTAKIGDIIVGGQPPTFDDIEDNLEELKLFTSALFDDDVSERWNPKVREILVMALLLRYDQFCEVLQSHPEAYAPEHLPEAYATDVIDGGEGVIYYPIVRDHLFVCRVKQALVKAGATCDNMFSSWKLNARMAFLSRNIPGIPIQKFPLYGGECGDIRMDPRCFVDHFNALASVTQSMHMELQNQKHMINDLRNSSRHEALTGDFLIRKIISTNRSVQRIENHLMGETPRPDAPPSSEGTIKFSISNKGLTNQMSLADVTTAFFADNYPAGFALDMKSDSWKDLDQKERKKLRNRFQIIKRAVRMVLMHADSYPLPPEDPSQYKEVIRGIATQAEERIRNEFCFAKKTKISIHTLTTHLEMKTFEKTLKLPENTPEEARKFFKSD
jgi:hypothetical protein